MSQEKEIVDARITIDVVSSGLIKDKIEEVAENKDIPIILGTDTPLSLLTKIDNGTVKTPVLQEKAVTITQNGTQTVEADAGYDALSGVTLTINVAGGSEEIEVTLPSAFSKCTNIYYCDVENNKYLISGNGYPHTTVGVWLYNATSNTISQIYDQADAWVYVCQKVGNNWLIGSGYTGSTGVLLYNPANDTISKISNVMLTSFLLIEPNKCICTDQSISGFYLYDDTTTQISLLYQPSRSGTITNFAEVNGKYLLTGNIYGAYLYNPSTSSVTPFITTARNLTELQVVGSDCLISSTASGSANVGIWLYNDTDGTITKIYTTGYYWQFKIVGSNCLASPNNTSTTGIVLYDGTTKTATQIYTTGNRWMFSTYVIGQKCLLSSSSISGILLYNNSTASISQIYTSGLNYQFHQVINSKILISSISGNSVVLLFNNADDSISTIYSTSSTWTKMFDIENNVLICDNGSNKKGILLYDSTTETVTALYSAGSYWNIEMLSASTCYLYSNNSTNGRKLFYDNSTKSIDLIAYRL